MTTPAPAPADPGVSVTLPGPSITATVSWEQVRAYLTREGWVPCADIGGGVWAARGSTGMVQVGLGIKATICTLARIAKVSPGEMLQRIAVVT